jgi:hypothetical protein
MSGPPSRRTLRLIDLTGLVAGYGLAALLIRAFWHASEEPAAVAAVVGFVYLWLGLAMSGPIVLLLDRRATPRPGPHRPTRTRVGAVPASDQVSSSDAGRPPDRGGPPPEPSTTDGFGRYTRAELAWLSIGAYWIFMTFLVVPTRLHDTALAMVAVLQIVAALALWAIAPRQVAPAPSEVAWTHLAAVGLLWTWPLAWAAMVLLSKTLS